MSRHAKLLLCLGLAVGPVASAVPASAQVTATVVTRSGERHTGRNLGYRVDDRQVAVRTSQHEEPRIPVDQVAYIDFGGTSDSNVSLSGSEQAVVLRNGTVLKGQVVELGHVNRADEKTDYLVTFRTQGGEERRLKAAEVARVYFNAPSGTSTGSTGSATQPPTGTTGGGITVSAKQQWTPTGLMVRKGEWIVLNTTGEIRLSGNSGDVATANGSTSQRREPGAPLPQTLAGALIGRIGNGQPFGIGGTSRLQIPEDGQLFLGINDSNLGDNEGAFQVTVQRTGLGRRR